jgi:hypothetical protein
MHLVLQKAKLKNIGSFERVQMRSLRHLFAVAMATVSIALGAFTDARGQNGQFVGETPQFALIRRPNDGSISLQWKSQSNGIYRIDYAAAIGAWITYYSNFPAQGTNTVWSDLGNAWQMPPIKFPGEDPQRFYRVTQTATNDILNAPIVSILSPTNGATVSGTTPAIVSLNDSSSVTRVRFFVDGVEAGNNPGANTNFAINTTQFANGLHAVFAAADDVKSNCGVSAICALSFSNLVQDWYGRTMFTNSPSNGSSYEYRADFGTCANWLFTVTNQDGPVVRKIAGSGSCLRLYWDGNDDFGSALPDGTYGVTLTATPSSDPCTGGNNWFVRPVPSGLANGMNWYNAWGSYTNIVVITDTNSIPVATNFIPTINIDWSKIHPGDTIWVAGGNYGQLFISASGAPGQPIYIKHVLSTDFVATNTPGWLKRFAGMTPVINLVSCHEQGWGNYVTIDGRVPYGGMIITNTSTDETYIVDLNGSGASYLELLNLDIGGVATLNTIYTGEGRCLSATGPSEGLHVAYCKLHGSPTLILTGNQDNMLWEHNFFYDNVVGNPADWHPNLWNSVGTDNNCIFRYNEASNYMVEGIMFSTGSANTNWQIYGNFFHDGTPGGTSRILEAQVTTHGPVFLYNNTFVNLATGVRVANDGSWTNCQSMNNLFFQAGDPLSYGFGLGGDDYNMADTTVLDTHGIGLVSPSVFVNYAGGNYTIVTNVGPLFPRNKGTNLGSTFSIDFYGNTRGVDGTWDIGAVEVQP